MLLTFCRFPRPSVVARLRSGEFYTCRLADFLPQLKIESDSLRHFSWFYFEKRWNLSCVSVCVSVCARTLTTFRFTIRESSRSWLIYKVLFYAWFLWPSSCDLVRRSGVSRRVFLQVWERVAARGTAGHCCTETPCWLRRLFIKVSRRPSAFWLLVFLTWSDEFCSSTRRVTSFLFVF